MIDDDQDVEIRKIPPDGVMDPVAPRVRSVQDDLEDATVFESVGLTGGGRLGERPLQDMDHPQQFSALERR